MSREQSATMPAAPIHCNRGRTMEHCWSHRIGTLAEPTDEQSSHPIARHDVFDSAMTADERRIFGQASEKPKARILDDINSGAGRG